MPPRLKIDWQILSILLVIALVFYAGWKIQVVTAPSGKCDCAKICNSEFKCGLNECPTGRVK